MTKAQQDNAERLAKLAVQRALDARREREQLAEQRIGSLMPRLTEDEQRQLDYICQQLHENQHEYEGREQLLVERRSDILSRVERRVSRHPVPTEVPAIADEWAREDEPLDEQLMHFAAHAHTDKPFAAPTEDDDAVPFHTDVAATVPVQRSFNAAAMGV